MQYDEIEDQYLEQKYHFGNLFSKSKVWEVVTSFLKMVRVKRNEKGEIIFILPPFEMFENWLEELTGERFPEL